MSDAKPTVVSPAASTEPIRKRHTAPFLVWPVARREFYASISFALVLPLAWGLIIFGWRAALVLLATLAGAIAAHLLLKRLTRRGKCLFFWHTMASALVLVALSQALWPPMVMAGAGAGMVGLLWLFGGAGHERVHASLLLALLLTFLLAPPQWKTAEPDEGPILARDRLFMGDLAQGAPRGLRQWPQSFEIGGQDAVIVPRPNVVVADLMRTLSRELDQNLPLEHIRGQVVQTINDALVERLPSIETLLLGAIPGPIGAVSALGIILGGLYLAYRNILRPRSLSLFLAAVVAGLAMATLSAQVTSQLGGLDLRRAWTIVQPAEALTLLVYEFFSADILFASVYILALPGAEPITPQGRRWFLIFAGLTAGLLHRANLPVPTSTLVLVAFGPLAPVFDWLLGRRSWLNARR